MKINIELLKKNIQNGYIKSQTHPTLDLTIYNYTNVAQYDNHWDDITMMCRGLILDSNYNIIERPFKKFFNKDEHDRDNLPNIPNLPFEVYDKLDGSLGILYWDGDEPHIASRGSFTSEQALMGTNMLHTNYRHTWGLYDKSKTYVFEIIYQSNRIVVDYGNKEELVLLGIIDTETGEDISIDTVSSKDFHKAERYTGIKDFKKLQSLDLKNKEGFVIRFSNGFRMKLKFDEYCRLHRIVTNISSYDIWDILRNGGKFDEILDNVPDEFYDSVRDCEKKLTTEYNNIYNYYNSIFNKLNTLNLSDKDFALEAKKYKFNSILFSFKNSKKVDDIIWKNIKPKYEIVFRKS